MSAPKKQPFGGKKAAPFTKSGRDASHPNTAKGQPRKGMSGKKK